MKGNKKMDLEKLKLSSHDIKFVVTHLLERVEEIRPQMPDPPANAITLVELLVGGHSEVDFGDEYVAAEMCVAAGTIGGIATALGCTPAELMAELGTDEA